MASNLDRRLTALEFRRKDNRPVSEMSDAELLEVIGWKGSLPPTDDELQAMARAWLARPVPEDGRSAQERYMEMANGPTSSEMDRIKVLSRLTGNGQTESKVVVLTPQEAYLRMIGGGSEEQRVRNEQA